MWDAQTARPQTFRTGNGWFAYNLTQIQRWITNLTLSLNQYQGGMCISGVLKTTARTPRHLI